MNINRAIARIGTIFIVAYAILFARQLYVAVIDGPRLAANVHNPRAALIAPYRGTIVARDGSVLARSNARGRVYPLGAAAAHAVGYASARYGTAGLEAVFDRELAPRAAANDPLSEIVRLVRRERPAVAVRGGTVVTTIDPVVQRTLYEALAAYPRAAGVALDPRSGEVLAIASVPSFDPNEVDRTFARIVSDPQSPLLDRATDGLYPPGSTFKIVTASAALEAGVVTPASRFEDSGTLPVGTFVVHDDEGEATGNQDLTGAFAKSSNVDFAQIALRLGADRWVDQVARWDIGGALGFTLPASADRVPARADLSPGVLAQLGFGQANLLVTPLRMALVAATVASGGSEPRPTLVRAAPAPLATPISVETAGTLSDMMVAVVRRGTGFEAALDGATVAGKTGTATVAAGTSHAWFVAFAPAGAPRVAVAIVVENAGYGGAVAAPIARRVIAAALARDHG
ncbi:MAG: penicillin-binding protein 2 [Candidatus Eremiobacteraeota bacterium]|nr:penicillin-binding protein 2 [Candidatus Eremiobacteraeota bacterium]